MSRYYRIRDRYVNDLRFRLLVQLLHRSGFTPSDISDAAEILHRERDVAALYLAKNWLTDDDLLAKLSESLDQKPVDWEITPQPEGK